MRGRGPAQERPAGFIYGEGKAEVSHVLEISPGVVFLVRDSTTVQFGLDATRCGLIEVTQPHTVVSALRGQGRVTTRRGLEVALHEAGLSAAAAASLVEEMVDFGVWRPRRKPESVAVLGTSSLATALRATLKSEGFRVRSPGPSTPAAELPGYISLLGPATPVFAVDLLHLAHPLTLALRDHTESWVPITSCDTRVFCGPVHRTGRGPCLLCFNLYRSEVDPRWAALVDSLNGAWPLLDAPLTGVTRAQVVAMARFFTGRPPLAGDTPSRWMPGETYELTATGARGRRFLEPHARCPLCFVADPTGHQAEDDDVFGEGITAPLLPPLYRARRTRSRPRAIPPEPSATPAAAPLPEPEG